MFGKVSRGRVHVRVPIFTSRVNHTCFGNVRVCAAVAPQLRGAEPPLTPRPAARVLP